MIMCNNDEHFVSEPASVRQQEGGMLQKEIGRKNEAIILKLFLSNDMANGGKSTRYFVCTRAPVRETKPHTITISLAIFERTRAWQTFHDPVPSARRFSRKLYSIRKDALLLCFFLFRSPKREM